LHIPPRKKVLIDRFTINFMDTNAPTPGILRLAAAVILGIIVGFILFLIVALFIGMFNNWMGMDIPVGTDIAENIFSAVLLVIFVVGSVTFLCWKVWTTPPTEEEEENPAP
jgi:heme/copper-type cytochrome/quinol oxidase subunit 2